VEEEEGFKPSSNLHLILDDIEMNDINDDVMEELCVGNDYNIRSKGDPTPNNSSSTLKPVAKKTLAATTST
jgi:hypothetical protein